MILFRYIKNLAKGQSLTRILMNFGFADFVLKGKVIDVGGGRSPDYFNYFKKEGDVSVQAVDGSINKIDFEKDDLPFEYNSIDTVICANVLEHIFNYNHLIGEIRRIMRPGGQLIGFVPFLINYHPDPHDYFRYTNEALNKILTDNGFANTKIITIGSSPFFANYNNLMNIFPKILRTLIFVPCYILDRFYVYFRPEIKKRFPLGYIIYSIK
jgi:SAM-dependent methyltransferase